MCIDLLKQIIRVKLWKFLLLICDLNALIFSRCDLFIIANGKKEKIASGLLNPFLAHLRTAQDQIAKGGYSVLLEPDAHVDASWFTKGTVERFVVKPSGVLVRVPIT